MSENKGGRPVKWETPEALQADIDKYFSAMSRTKAKTEQVQIGTDEHGKPVYADVPLLNDEGQLITELEWFDTPTMSGLALHIGCDRLTLTNYGHQDRFSNTIKRAKQKIEAYLEKRLDIRPQAVGTIFALKNNNDWKDAQVLTVSQSKALPTYDVSRMTLEQKRALYDLLMLASQDPDADIDIPQITQD